MEHFLPISDWNLPPPLSPNTDFKPLGNLPNEALLRYVLP